VGDVERGEIAADHLHHHGDGLGPHHRQPFGLGLRLELVAGLGGQHLPDRHQIIAGIQPVRNRADILAERLAVPQEGGPREHVDLGAGVVDVIFPGDVEAGRHQQARQSIAEHRAAAMTDMHRPRRVGRDVFHIDLLGGADGAPAVAGAIAQNGAQRIGPDRGLEGQVDEAGTGDLDRRDQGVGAQFAGNRLGEVFRLRLRLFGQHHRRVGCHVAMGNIPGRLDHHARQVETGRQHAFGSQRGADRMDAGENVSEQMRRARSDHGTTEPGLRRTIPAGLHQVG
jgi:hypothetical protein